MCGMNGYYVDEYRHIEKVCFQCKEEVHVMKGYPRKKEVARASQMTLRAIKKGEDITLGSQ